LKKQEGVAEGVDVLEGVAERVGEDEGV